MNILVCGDSYATLDPSQRHWATLWAKENNYNIEHYGHPGESHVNIVSKILHNKNISDFNLIIYHITDFLRTQIDIGEAHSLDIILDKSLDLYSDKNFTFKENLSVLTSESKVRKGKHYIPVNISPIFLDPKFTQEKICKTKTSNLYNSINLYWLLQSNYNSLLLLIEKCKNHNVPIILVLEPQLSLTADESFYPDDVYIFKTDKSDIGDDYCNHSLNHLSYNMHEVLKEDFKQFIVNNNILKH